MPADKLGPIEIEFNLDKKADEEAKKLKKDLDKLNETTTDIERSSEKVVEAVKKETSAFLSLDDQIKKVWANLKKAISTGSLKEAEELTAKLKDLENQKAELLRIEKENAAVQAEVITANKEEALTVENLSDTVGEWAINLGGATAILSALVGALKETTGGINAFNLVGQVAKQVLYNIVTGTADWTKGIYQAIVAQKQLNALRVEEKISTGQAKDELVAYNTALVNAHDQTRTVTERIQSYDEALAHHKKSVDIEIASTEKQKKAYADLLEQRPDDEKLKMQWLDLRNKLKDLKNDQIAAMKEITSMQTGLMKKDAEEKQKVHDDAIAAIRKAADEQIEIDHSIGAQQDLLMKAVEDGNVREIKSIADRIFALQKELDVRREIAKQAVLSAFGGNVGKVAVPDAPILGTKTTLPGLQPASSNAQQGVDMGKMKEWNQDDAKNDEKKLDNKKELLRVTGQITAELVQQVGLEEDVVQGFEMFADLISGDLIGAAASMLGQLIKLIPNQASKFEAQIDRINILLEKQQKLIEDSKRFGGTKEATEIYLKQLEAKEGQLIRQIGLAAAKGDGKLAEQLMQDLLNVQNEIGDTKLALEDLKSGGITQNAIADAIAQGFEDGKTSVDDFAAYMDEVLKQGILQMFKQDLLDSPLMKDYWNYIKEALSDKVLTPEEKAKIDAMGAELGASMKPAWDLLNQGFTNAAEAVSQDPLKGSIKGVTEQTADVLAGNTNAIRINQVNSITVMRSVLTHVAKIEDYTSRLISIDDKMSELIRSGSLRSQGIA
jgi:hypothetical protein